MILEAPTKSKSANFLPGGKGEQFKGSESSTFLPRARKESYVLRKDKTKEVTYKCNLEISEACPICINNGLDLQILITNDLIFRPGIMFGKDHLHAVKAAPVGRSLH